MMRSAAKQAAIQAARLAPNQLDWSVLDVEPEEWNRRTADLGAATAANGFPVYAAAGQAGTDGRHGGSSARSRRGLEIGRRVLLAVAAALVLTMIMGYLVWRTAQAGIANMEGDVANVVKLEMVRRHQQGPQLQAGEDVQSVEFVDGTAMATVLMTHTLPSGKIVTQRGARFFVQTAKGWQPSQPLAAFWAPAATLDTADLHFVFGRRDQVVVEQFAPAAEAIYRALRRATGQDLAATGLLTVEIGIEQPPANGGYEDGRIHLTAPLLLDHTSDLSVEDIFHLGLRKSLGDQMLAAALHSAPAKPQWTPMVGALDSWLQFSAAAYPPPFTERTTLQRLRSGALELAHLDALLDEPLDSVSSPSSPAMAYNPDSTYAEERRWVAAEQLLEYIVATYGIDVLPKLLEGFAYYDDWETLAPAVLGVSAGELQAAWHAAPK